MCDELKILSENADCVSGPSIYHGTTLTSPDHVQVGSSAIRIQQEGNGRSGGSSDVVNMDAVDGRNTNRAEGIYHTHPYMHVLLCRVGYFGGANIICDKLD